MRDFDCLSSDRAQIRALCFIFSLILGFLRLSVSRFSVFLPLRQAQGERVCCPRRLSPIFPRLSGSSPFLRFSVFLCLLLPFLFASTGNSIERVFQVNNEPTEGNSVFPLEDGYLVLTNHDGKQNFTKFDLLGKPLFSKDFYDANGGWPHSAIRTSDDGYLIVGLRVADRPQKGYVIKLDEDLDFVWGWDVAHTDLSVDLWISGVRQTSEGGYIITVKGQFFDRFTREPFWGLVKLDSKGEIQWQRRIVAGPQTNVFDVLQIGARYVIYGGIYPPDSSDWDLYIGVLNDPDHGDSVAWQIALGGHRFDGASTVEPAIYPNASNIVQVGPDQIAVAAYTKSYGDNPGAGETDGNSILLLLVSMDGTSATLRILDGPRNDRIGGPYGGPNLIRLADGNLLLGGMSSSNTYFFSGAYLVKLAPDLSTILWQNDYFIGSSSFECYSPGLVFGMAETPAGGIAVAGKTPEDAFFMVLSGTGNNENGCTFQVPSSISMSEVTPDIATVIPDDVFQLVSSDPRVVLTPISSTISDTTLNLICYSNLTITPSPLDHDFGEVPVGSKSASLEIALSNSGSATGSLVIKEINFTGPDKGDFTGNVGACGSHTILDPGDSCKASVAFFPKSAGAKSTTIEIITNDPDNPRWTGTLKGTGVPPQDIPVAPRNVPFRDIPVGKASDQTARVEKATPGSGIMG